MSLLSSQSIRGLCKHAPPLVYPWEETRIKGSSYDLSLGNEYYLYDRKAKPKKIENMINELVGTQELVIPSREICIVITKEKVSIPKDIAARVSLMTDVILKGVVITEQPPIDPGYDGKIYILLHNLSNKDVHLKCEDPILTIEFYQLDKMSDKPYDGRLPGLAGLKQEDNKVGLSPYMTIFDSGLSELQDTLTKKTERFQNSIPNILMAITVVVGILTIVITIGITLLFVFGVPWIQNIINQLIQLASGT